MDQMEPFRPIRALGFLKGGFMPYARDKKKVLWPVDGSDGAMETLQYGVKTQNNQCMQDVIMI